MSAAGKCFGSVIVPPVHLGAFSVLENKLIAYSLNHDMQQGYKCMSCVTLFPESWHQQGYKCMSGVTFAWDIKLNAVRLRLWKSPGYVRCIPVSPINNWKNFAEVVCMMILIYRERHMIPRWLLRSIFARFLEQLLKGLVSWASPL